jgi:hypothetical protein
MVQQLRERIDKQEYMKYKSFCKTTKRNGHQIEKTAYRMGESFCQLYIQQSINEQSIQITTKISEMETKKQNK